MKHGDTFMGVIAVFWTWPWNILRGFVCGHPWGRPGTCLVCLFCCNTSGHNWALVYLKNIMNRNMKTEDSMNADFVDWLNFTDGLNTLHPAAIKTNAVGHQTEWASKTDGRPAAECNRVLPGVAEEWTEKDEKLEQVPRGWFLVYGHGP